MDTRGASLPSVNSPHGRHREGEHILKRGGSLRSPSGNNADAFGSNETLMREADEPALMIRSLVASRAGGFRLDPERGSKTYKLVRGGMLID